VSNSLGRFSGGMCFDNVRECTVYLQYTVALRELRIPPAKGVWIEVVCTSVRIATLATHRWSLG